MSTNKQRERAKDNIRMPQGKGGPKPARQLSVSWDQMSTEVTISKGSPNSGRRKTYQSLRQKVDSVRVGVREQLAERLLFPEWKRPDVVPRPSRCNGVELVQGGCSKNIEDKCKLVVIVASGE